MLKITYNFTKYVIILTVFIINSFGGEMENNNISLDQDKILQVNIGFGLMEHYLIQVLYQN